MPILSTNLVRVKCILWYLEVTDLLIKQLLTFEKTQSIFGNNFFRSFSFSFMVLLALLKFAYCYKMRRKLAQFMSIVNDRPKMFFDGHLYFLREGDQVITTSIELSASMLCLVSKNLILSGEHVLKLTQCNKRCTRKLQEKRVLVICSTIM